MPAKGAKSVLGVSYAELPVCSGYIAAPSQPHAPAERQNRQQYFVPDIGLPQSLFATSDEADVATPRAAFVSQGRSTMSWCSFA